MAKTERLAAPCAGAPHNITPDDGTVAEANVWDCDEAADRSYPPPTRPPAG